MNKNIPNNTQDYVKNFYTYINNKNHVWLISIFDAPFKNNTTIKTYFSEKRLNKFINSIDWLLKPREIVEVTNDRKDTDSIIKRSYKYLLKYKIDNKNYKESWKMTLISRNWGKNFLVNSLFCESDGCSKSPFYK